MSRIWLVARHEYRLRVLQRGFIWVILSVPLLIALTIGLITLTDMMRYNGRPVGYVDQGGWLAEPVYTTAESSRSLLDIFSKRPVTFIPYATEAVARKALESGELQAYYVLPPDYLQSQQAQLVYLKAPGQNATQQFRQFIQDNLLAQQSPEVARRASEGAFLTVRTPDNRREYREKAPINFILPLLLSMAFMILFASSSMTLVQAVVEDKENRIVELLATSVSPSQLIGGKVLGIVAMGLTQVVAWTACIALGLWAGQGILGLEWVRYIRIPAQTLVLIIAAAIPTYVLFSALMTAMASAVADTQESQQLGGVIGLSLALPLWAIQVLVEHPGSPLAIALTLFPLTSLTTLCVRSAFSSVPTWQIAASLAILCLSALAATWAAGRAFRLGMLRYGQRLPWRELFQRPQSVSAAEQNAGR